MRYQLYWTDTTDDVIRVSDLEGKNTRILISLGLDEPRGIALDPERGWADVHEDIKINDFYRFIMFDRDPRSPPVN